MNRNGRVVGGVLIGIALLWLLGALGVFRFNNRSTNQVFANTPTDRPPVSDPNAIATSETSTLPPSPPTGTQGFRPETGGQTTAQNNNTGTPGTTSGTTGTTPGTANTTTEDGVTYFESRPATSPAVRAGW